MNLKHISKDCRPNTILQIDEKWRLNTETQNNCFVFSFLSIFCGSVQEFRMQKSKYYDKWTKVYIFVVQALSFKIVSIKMLNNFLNDTGSVREIFKREAKTIPKQLFFSPLFLFFGREISKHGKVHYRLCSCQSSVWKVVLLTMTFIFSFSTALNMLLIKYHALSNINQWYQICCTFLVIRLISWDKNTSERFFLGTF